tara:strand:- start:5 stop:514 length:510 start_codon:yes stop_codon:yes gene_type:complete
MEIRNRSTGELTTVSQFKASLPNTSFPKLLTADILDSYGYDPLLPGPSATVSGPYEISVRDGVEEVDGQWFTKYVVGPKFTDTTDEEGNVTSAADNEANYRAGVDAEAAYNIRQSRNQRLAECDWTQLADQPFSAEDQAAWADYRQALRDLPDSEEFPHDVTWPEKPGA